MEREGLLKGFRIKVPTPYPIGDVFCYLSVEPPVTLVDVGVNTDEAWEALVSGFAKVGLSPGQVEVVALTHGHADHYGQVFRLHRESGCRVLLNPRDFSKVHNRYAYYSSMVPYLRRAGMPQLFVDAFLDVLDEESSFIEDPPKDILFPLNEGDLLPWMGEVLRVVHLPGHSQGQVGLVHEDGWAITGDLVFSSMTPDPIIHIEDDGTRARAMHQHLDSLARLEGMGVETFFPAHKEESGNLREAVGAMGERIVYKEKLVLEVVRALGEATPFSIMLRLTPEVNENNQFGFVALSDTLGRLDLLEEKGLVRCEDTGERLLYSAC